MCFIISWPDVSVVCNKFIGVKIVSQLFQLHRFLFISFPFLRNYASVLLRFSRGLIKINVEFTSH